MTDESGLIKTYRSRVIGISAGLIVYAIAGGAISTAQNSDSAEITLFGVKLFFHRPDWLVWAAVVALLYFWWRHFQLITVDRNRFYQDVYSNALIPQSIVKKIESGVTGSDDIIQTDYDYGVEARRGDITVADVDSWKDYIVMIKCTGFIRYSFTMFKISSWHLEQYFEEKRPYHFETWGETRSYDTKRFHERVHVFLIYLRSYVSLMLKSPRFADAVLPDIMVVLSVATVILNASIAA